MTRSSPLLIFAHGWGFDAAFWSPLRRYLDDWEHASIDFGYGGRPRPWPETAGRDYVAVTHSFGTLWTLLHRFKDCHGLVSINGFPRFSETSDYAPAVKPRLIERMLARLDTTPEQVTADFRQRCGIAEPLAGTLDAKTLKRDLKVLRDGDARPELCRFVGPLLHLAGGGDAIVPREMAAHAFKAAQNLTQIWLPEGGHALPLSAPAWCGAEIRRFLSEHFESR